jgi:hypothetical protein
MNIEQPIDAFIDGEIVDMAALDAALASTEGRAYLFDALALRRLMQDEAAVAVAPRTPTRTLQFYARAAVVAIGLLGAGYFAGSRDRVVTIDAPATTAQAEQAPEPTRVIELKPGINWHETKGGD